MPYILSPLIKENMSGMWLEGASESPVTPVLFKYDEINNRF